VLVRRFLFAIITSFFLLPAASAAEPWYAGALSAFVKAGYVTEGSIVPERDATRASFVELTLKLLGGRVTFPFLDQVFDDVGEWHRSYAAFQQGARDNWVLGLQNCAGSHPCMAAPDSSVTRAEAAALLVRAFRFQAAAAAPAFSDNDPDAWYAEYVTIASSRCILRGDAGKTTVRPGDAMNEAEMLAMLQRSQRGLRYPACDEPVLDALPEAEPGFVLQQASSSSAASTSVTASSSSFSSFVASSSSSATSTTSPAPSSTSSAVSMSSSATFDLTPLSPPSTAGVSSGQSQDPHYQDLLIRYQQYLANFSTQIARARSADSASAVTLLTALNAQNDLLYQLYPWVVASKSRVLTANEWVTVTALENRIRGGFAAIR
jgi:hypothetical protein